jgi:hypothetical protein
LATKFPAARNAGFSFATEFVSGITPALKEVCDSLFSVTSVNVITAYSARGAHSSVTLALGNIGHLAALAAETDAPHSTPQPRATPREKALRR